MPGLGNAGPLRLTYAKDLGVALWADALGCRAAIFQSNLLRAFYLPLAAALEAIGFHLLHPSSLV
jgi:hypothetical protein